MATTKTMTMGNADTTVNLSINGTLSIGNSSTEISSTSTDSEFPTAKAVYDAIGNSKVEVATVEETLAYLGIELRNISTEEF